MTFGLKHEDPFVTAVATWESLEDDIYNALFAGASNAARALIPEMVAAQIAMTWEGEFAGVSRVDGDTPPVQDLRPSRLDDRVVAELRVNRRAEGRCVNCGRPDAGGECAICTVSYAPFADDGFAR